MTNILTSTTTLMSLVTKELKEQLLKKQFCLHCTSSPILDWPLSSLRTMSVISWASLCSKQISAKVFFLFKKVIATIKCSPITQLFETKSFETLKHSLENIISSGLVEVILQFCAPIYYSQQVQLKERDKCWITASLHWEIPSELLLLYNINTVDKIAISVFPHNSECHLNDFVTQRFNLRVFPSVYK